MKKFSTHRYKNYRNHEFGTWQGVFLRILKRLQWERSERKTNTSKNPHSRFEAQLLLMYLVNTGIPLNGPALSRLMQIHPQTVANHISSLYLDHTVEIPWIEDRSINGAGYYRIDDWGVYDKGKVIQRVIKKYGLREIHKALNVRRDMEGLSPL